MSPSKVWRRAHPQHVSCIVGICHRREQPPSSMSTDLATPSSPPMDLATPRSPLTDPAANSSRTDPATSSSLPTDLAAPRSPPMHALSSPSMDLVALSLPLMDPSPGPRRATRSRRCSRSGEGEACLLLGREGSSHHGHRATRTRALVPPQRGSARRDMRGREPTGEREGAPRERGTSMGAAPLGIERREDY